MQSLASLMSVNNNDIAPLGDFDDDEDAEGEFHCVIINLPWFCFSYGLSLMQEHKWICFEFQVSVFPEGGCSVNTLCLMHSTCGQPDILSKKVLCISYNIWPNRS